MKKNLQLVVVCCFTFLSTLLAQSPSISVFSPTSGKTGDQIIIAGANFTGVTDVLFGGVPASSFNVISSGAIIAFVGSGASGNVSVMNGSGTGTLAGFTYIASPPTISAFSPTSGVVGTSVTIKGTNFNPVSANNIVYFGAVKATVTSATSTELIVRVPNGATYQPISVTNQNLTAYSSKPFTVTFFGGGTAFDANSFSTEIKTSTSNGSFNPKIADLDGDGKPDVIIASQYSNTISIHRNTTTSTGSISFANSIELATNVNPVGTAIADFDGDGKLDVVSSSYQDNNISIYKNSSTVGSIFFSTAINYNANANPTSVSVSDFDNDGKPDLVVANVGSANVSVYLNTSTGGVISFANKIDFAVGSYPWDISVGDIDGDGKGDIISANQSGASVSVLRNTSTSTGVISFATKVDLTSGVGPRGIYVADLDNDGKLDITVSNVFGSSVSLLRNLSNIGSINFATRTILSTATGGNVLDITLNDFDGDGKVDIVAAIGASANKVSVFRNISNVGNVQFNTVVNYSNGNNIYSITSADFDGDSKPEILAANPLSSSNYFSILRNQIGSPVIAGFTPTSGIAGTQVIISGSNFTGVTGVSFGGVAAASFTVISSTAILAVVGSGASGNVVVTTATGAGSLAGFVFTVPIPTITSFSPASGTIGSTVTITGTNFSTTPANNIVYFGAVKATVTAATATSLNVTVPVGATFYPITVATNNLTAFSTKPFIVTFSGGGSTFTSNSFQTKQDFSVGINPSFPNASDLDGDGKPDILVSNLNSNTVSIFRNNSTGIGSISLSNKLDISAGSSPFGNTIFDLDGDGKQDLIVCNYYNNNSVSILRNTSTVGNISFTTPLTYSTPSYPVVVVVGDVDGDGRPDLLVSSYYGNSVSVFLNTSTPGNLSFANKVDFTVGNGPIKIGFGDIDGDGKPDIVAANQAVNTISVLLNNSTIGNAVFATKVDFVGAKGTRGIAIGDIDGDGKQDIVVGNYLSNTISVFRNTSSLGSVSLASRIDATAISGSWVIDISIMDVDGDGKIDILAVDQSPANKVSVFKNTSSIGSISLNTPVNYSTGTDPYSLTNVDLDGDGKPEIITSNSSDNTISILRNQIGDPVISAFTPTSGIAGTQVIITGSNFTGVTGVSFGGVAAASYTVINSTTILAIVGSGVSGNVVVTTASGVGSLAGFTFVVPPTIDSFNPTSGTNGTIVTISGTNFTGATSVTFGGVGVTSFTVVSATTISATISNGASGNVVVTTPSGSSSLAGFTYSPPPPTIRSFSPTIGTNGTIVTIKGINFLNVTAVNFGGVAAAAFSILNDTTIYAQVSNGASGNVSVTNSNGTGSLGGFAYSSFLYCSPNKGNNLHSSSASSLINSVVILGTTLSNFNTGSPSNGYTLFSATGSTTATLIKGTIYTLVVSISSSTVASLWIDWNQNGTYESSEWTQITANGSGTVSVPFTVSSTASLGLTGMRIRTRNSGSQNGASDACLTFGSGETEEYFVTIADAAVKPSITSFTPTSATNGTTVTITGSNFTGATAVTFGGVAATSFSVVNASTITAVIGAGASGDVSVTNTSGTGTLSGFNYCAAAVTQTTNLSGCSSVVYKGITYNSSTVFNDTLKSVQGCDSVYNKVNITINTPTVPTFTQVAAICNGGAFTLPTTSLNGITGTWSPAINNAATTTYTFTPTTGQCATTASMTVTVNASIVPSFNQVAAICSGGTFTLPTTSLNGIIGTWSPAINNTATTTYTFTPTTGQCATTASMTVTVNASIVPSFTQVAAICKGGTFTLPTTSLNGITGTWSPAINNTATTTYTFTPTSGQCATTASMTVTVNASIVPSFTQMAAICSGGTFTLPTTSLNGITGTWSPAINNTATTTYTFTPTTGQCATTASMTVTVNASIVPSFTQVAAICKGGTFTLPTTSLNGITGTWSPAINNTATTTYTFTPTAGQCATTASMTVTVNASIVPSFTQVAAICRDSSFVLPTISNNSITGTWSPAIDTNVTTTYTFTPSAGQCATTTTMTVVIVQPKVPFFNSIAPICKGETFSLPNSSLNGIYGYWYPAINNTQTTTYFFEPYPNQCAIRTTMTVVVNTSTVPTFSIVSEICDGGTFSLPTTSLNGIAGTWSPVINNTTTTTYTFTPNSGQCATSITTTVKVNKPTSSTTNLSICPSALPYSWNGLTFTAAGSQTKTGLVNSQGCDSSATLILKVGAVATTNAISLSGCNSVVYKSKTYTVSSVVRDTIKNAFGCDSVYNVATITVNPIVAVTNPIALNGCNSVIYKTKTYTVSTVVRDTIKSFQGCDSIYNVATITVTTPLTPSVSISASATTITAGTNVTFFANPINGGTTPIYEWYKNGVRIVGVNGSNYSTTTLANRDSIYVLLTSNLTCVTNPTAVSNSIIITVNSTQYSLSGSVKNPQNVPIPNAVVTLNGINPQKVTGSYNFNVAPSANYTIKVAKNNDKVKSNGVSVIDAILVQSHILNKVVMNSPYKIIAADVNKSGDVSTIDILYIKRLILGIDTTFPSNRLWAFVDSAYQFPNVKNPFPYTDSILINNVASNQTNKSFIGVKLGDVNFDWDVSVAKGATKPSTPVELFYSNIDATNQEEIRIPVYVNNFKNLLGMQYTLNFNCKSLALKGIEQNKLNIEYGIQQSKEGKISFLWNDENGNAQTLKDGSVLMELVFAKKAPFAQEDFTLSNDIANIEAWDANMVKHAIEKTGGMIQQKQEVFIAKESWEVVPNPTVDGKVKLSFSVPSTKEIGLTLTSSDGKVWMQQKLVVQKGMNTYRINLQSQQQLAKGVYYLQANGMEGEKVKVIVIK